MFVRYASAIASGTFMTLGLLFVMQSLISLQPGAISEPRSPLSVDWRIVRKPTPPPPKPTVPITLEGLTNAPLPPTQARYSGEGTAVGVHMTGTHLPNPDFRVTPLDNADGPLVVIVRVAPEYPMRASAEGREGYVVVQFDVTADGRVQNATVIESSNTMFEKSALKAAQRFKFRARVVEGVPQASIGIQNLFRFEMEQQ